MTKQRKQFMSFYHTIFFLLFITLNSCNLLKLKYVSPPPSFEEKNTELIVNKVDSTLQSQYKNINYMNYTYGDVITNKPNQFLKLDSIYTLRKRDKKDTLKQKVYNTEIEKLKKEINTKKLYHSYSIDHVYIVENETNFKLYESTFTFFPNYKLKSIETTLSTTLTEEEKDLFDYFSQQNQLFETYDYNNNNEMDQLVYDKFNFALSSATINKDKLIHTILYCIKYIRKYNDFNEQEIMEGLALRWIENNNLNSFKAKFNAVEKITKNDQLSSYKLIAENKKDNIVITFTFDLNLVLTETSIKT